MKAQLRKWWSTSHKWFTKNYWIWIIFGLLLTLSIWAVLCWGFGWVGNLPGTIKSNVAEGLLALSYSYIAGCIFSYCHATHSYKTAQDGTCRF